jgi:hypothetical protein
VSAGRRDLISRVNGVLLNYGDPAALQRHHTELKFQPSDRLRGSVIKAERALRILWIIVPHLEISDIGADRVEFALKSIEHALNVARDELGMSP